MICHLSDKCMDGGEESGRGCTYFVYVSPVLALIVQTFVQHANDVHIFFAMGMTP
jgi:hypothetical protein